MAMHFYAPAPQTAAMKGRGLHMLKVLRERAGLTQADLGEQVGASPQTVSKWEKGERDKTLDRVYKLCSALKTDPNTLFGYAPSEPAPQRAAPPAKMPPGLRRLPEYDVRAAAGDGAIAIDEAEIDEWLVPPSWLRKGRCAVVEVLGDSMTPDFLPGDKVVVDLADTRPSPPGVFVLWDGIGTVMKQVEVIDGSDPPTLEIKSRHTGYRAYERPLDDVRIAGRVIGLMRRL